jgi:hypothetical protein
MELYCTSAINSFVIYLDFITPLVGSQRQADAIYTGFSSAFDLVPLSLVLLDFLVVM